MCAMHTHMDMNISLHLFSGAGNLVYLTPSGVWESGCQQVLYREAMLPLSIEQVREKGQGHHQCTGQLEKAEEATTSFPGAAGGETHMRSSNIVAHKSFFA